LVHVIDLVCKSCGTLARAATDTFAGISPSSVPLFLGGIAATFFVRWLLGDKLAAPAD